MEALTMRKKGASFLAIAVYQCLADLGGEATYSQMWRELEITGAPLSRALNELLGAGYVAKLPHPTDERSYIYTITPF